MGEILMQSNRGTHLRIDGQIQDRRYSPTTHLRQDSSVPETRILRHKVNIGPPYVCISLLYLSISMCIVFYTLDQPGYRLYVIYSPPILINRILASNRDEYLDRPATPAGWHDFGDTPSRKDISDQAWVLSGRDTSSSTGGTWLGMTSDLRIGVM